MRPRLALALLVGIALVVVALAASGTSPVPYVDRDPGDDAAPTNLVSSQPRQVDQVGPSAAGGSLVVVLVVLSVLALVVFIGLITALRTPKRRRRGVGMVAEVTEDGGSTAPDVLVRGAREALEELRTRTGGPPRDAVVLAWLRLEQAAADSGAARAPHETPTEFTGALLARHHVDEDATGALRKVYQRARFGVTEVTDEDSRTAQDALERIVRDLAPARDAG
ncbi:hypothetical protein FHS29_002892 [Saccharothrix tamanrassetensis]|uniref:Protein-glutamine gamma-glutamyltransferase-like C-terminal domain-containing protein n=1 Tax=Saccharothrix tamanrassetensis TaxID=1051531 RepID=A0A841CL32_9PSEU|nr:DUF4129 domain-containing protein [Saccharothrix tamanrassetensis]MBB5956306.1 hypothetical protein [Saccharothrix tamanrassetensis]